MKLEHVDDLALLRLDNGKANALDPTLLVWLDDTLLKLMEHDHKATVITGYDRFFSAGLDLVTLSGFDREAMLGFMRLFNRVVHRMFSHVRPLVAAVNGHAVAGGTVLALQADWRVGPDGDLKMGLNETQLGVGIPEPALDMMGATLTGRSLARVALHGELHDAAACRELGLLDELVPADQVLDRALAKARELAEIPAPAWAQVKQHLRGALSATAGGVDQQAEDRWLDTWFSDEATRRRAAAVEKLTAKS